MKEITERTLVPLSLVITLVGGVSWLTTIHAQGQANAEVLVEVKNKQDKYEENLKAILNQLAEIKGELKRIRK